MRGILLACLLLLALPARAQALTIFAAASLTDAMGDIAALWQRAGHPAPTLSFGASSTLARQIEQGAPADVFASADAQWMDYLADRHLIAPDTRRDLLRNDLVLVVPADHKRTLQIAPGLDLAGLLGSTGRLAVGDPAHVPVGLYARQALTKLGLWDQVAARLAPTQDVRAGLLLVERGEAPAGIVYATDAAGRSAIAVAGIFPPDSHDPIVYPFAAMRRGETGEGRDFLRFLLTPAAQEAFKKRGFARE